MDRPQTALDEELLALLRGEPQGLAEHRLLKRLQASHPDSFPDDLFRDDLALFRAHFLLFNRLYRLRDQLADAGGEILEIDPRRIRVCPAAVADANAVDGHDPMRDYYLDLTHLGDTSAEDVEQMLGAFWARYYAGGRRGEALAVLGLEAGADLDTAQRRYRKLAMLHHPDRGGDAAEFARIREAIAILRRC